MKKDNRGLLVIVPLLLLVLVFAGSFLYDAILSVVRYTPAKGLFGSVFAGLAYYQKFFSMQSFGSILGNSLVQTLLTVLAGLPLGAAAALVLTSIGSRTVRTAAAGLMLLIALIPEVIWYNLFTRITAPFFEGQLMAYPNLYPLCFFLIKLIPQSALCAFGGLCLNIAEDKNGVIGAAAVGVLPLLAVLIPDVRTVHLLFNPVNLSRSETIPLYVYRTGLMNMQMGIASAAAVLGMLASLFVGLAPALGTGLLISRKPHLIKLERQGSEWLNEALCGLAGAAIGGVGLLILIALLRGVGFDSTSGRALLNTIFLAVLTFVPALIVSLVLLACSRHCRAGYGVGGIALLLSLLGFFAMSDYLVPRSLGLVNTLIPAALGTLVHPVFIAVLFVLMSSRPTTGRQLLLTAAGAAAAAAAISAGELFNANVFITSNDLRPLSSFAHAAWLRQDAYQDLTFLTALICVLPGIFAAALTMAGLGGTWLYRIPHPFGAPEAQPEPSFSEPASFDPQPEKIVQQPVYEAPAPELPAAEQTIAADPAEATAAPVRRSRYARRHAEETTNSDQPG